VGKTVGSQAVQRPEVPGIGGYNPAMIAAIELRRDEIALQV
jgi:hypothetical protein